MRLVVPALVALLAAAAPATATVVVVPTLEEMTWRSDVIIHATVVDQEVVEQKAGRVVTRTFLQVEDGVAGASKGELVVVEQLGGALGARRSWIAGAHKFKVGDEVLLFGARINNLLGESVVVPYGIGFGIFDIKDDVDGRHAVERGGGDVSQLVRAPDGTSSMKPVPSRHYTSLDEFKAQLRDILDGRRLGEPALKKILPAAPRRPTSTSTTAPTSKE